MEDEVFEVIQFANKNDKRQNGRGGTRIPCMRTFPFPQTPPPNGGARVGGGDPVSLNA